MADKLKYLFASVPRPDGRRWTQEEVADAIKRLAGGKITVDRGYISALYRGIKDNPTKKLLEALAAVFDVPAGYFFDDMKAQEIVQQIEFAKILRDGGVREVTARQLAELPTSDVEAVAAVIEALAKRRRTEGSG